MFPRSDGILLGGTHEEGVWSLEPNLERKQQILAAAQGVLRFVSGMLTFEVSSRCHNKRQITIPKKLGRIR